MTKSPKPVPTGLVGRHFFVVTENGTGEIGEQGYVVAQIDATHYLLQFYEWIAGGRTFQLIYPVEAMTVGAEKQFQFFDGAEDRTEWYECFGKYRGLREAAE